MALLLRSAGRPGQPTPDPSAELDYPSILNRVLPADIRVLGWTDVPEDFSARCEWGGGVGGWVGAVDCAVGGARYWELAGMDRRA